MMYRKHYNAIAAALRSGGCSEFNIHEIAIALAREALEQGRPFDIDKFEDKALYGDTQEQRAKKYRTGLKRIELAKAQYI